MITPLPWRIADDTYGVERIWATWEGSECDVASCVSDGSLPYEMEQANARYIVHTANLYPQLVEALKGLFNLSGPELMTSKHDKVLRAAAEVLEKCKELS